MTKRHRYAPSRPDEDNPEWTEEEFARARPAAEVLPKYIGEEATQELLRRSAERMKEEKRRVNRTLTMNAARLADADE
jgi:uncharacterized protein (DUF4415 family)